MNCVIKIGDREAVPVRAIPFVTGWSISPDVVARGLAGLDFNRRLKSLRAYHLDLDGNFSPMLSKEWDVVHDGLRALSASLRAGETAEGSSYPDWVRQSIPALPSHCFVWLDEFEPAARHAMNALMSLDEERDDENELNFSPRIPPGLVDAVFEGLPGAGAVLPLTPTEPATGGSTRTRHDDIQIEIDDVIADLEQRGEKATPAKVMAMLKERAGRTDSCIHDTAPDGVLWTRGSSGEQTKLTMEALKGRMKRTPKGTLRGR
jgi:hypothetical protein